MYLLYIIFNELIYVIYYASGIMNNNKRERERLLYFLVFHLIIISINLIFITEKKTINIEFVREKKRCVVNFDNHITVKLNYQSLSNDDFFPSSYIILSYFIRIYRVNEK